MEDGVDPQMWLKKLRELPNVRLAKVMKIREEIARGTYETEERWLIACKRLVEDLALED